MQLSQILAAKGSDVVTTHPGVSATQALRTLVDHDIGALVVMEEDAPVGIVTERDLLRFLARADANPEATPVERLMTRRVIVAGPRDPVQHAMHTMTENRVRHLPILCDGFLMGIVSIGDVVNALREETEEENHHLKEYIATAG